MPITRNSARKSKIEEANYYKIDSSSEDFNSDDSEEDPNFEDELDKAQSKISKLSITNKPNSREHIDLEVDDGEVSDMEEISVPVLNKTDLKNFDQVQKLIHAGQIEKLKVEQCKVYLRKHGLRLTGKKEILIQRIKEHLEILNGGGEKKYPPSSFVLNCKGDACMGDIVMFEQTVYEGYNLASRSAVGPPCGKRIVAGRIVKESYGAAKQQHTFTVEVLWSKGEKPLPPLHPLLIKGRNLYKSNTTRQRWQDEAERQRVLDEKHSRGSVALSNREARIQEKEARKMVKGNRAFSKVGQSSRDQKNIKHESAHITQQQQTSQEANPKFRAEFKGNSNQGMPKFPPNLANKPSIPIYKAQESYCPPTFQLSKSAESSYGSDCGYSKNSFTGNAQNSYPSKIGSPRFEHSKTVDLGSGSDCGYVKNSFTGNALKSYPSQIYSPTFQSKPAESSFGSDYGYLKNSSAGNAQTSCPSQIGPPIFQLGKPAESRLASHRGYLKNSLNGNAMCSDKYQQTRDPRHQLSRENKENSFPKPYFSECRNIANYPQGNVTFSDKPLHSNRAISYGRNHQRPSNTQQKICPYYPQGRCYYGNQCKFLHESNRNYC